MKSQNQSVIQERTVRSNSLTQKLYQPPKKMEQSYEELVMEKDISTVEKARLQAVFEQICSAGDEHLDPPGFNAINVQAVLNRLEFFMSRQEIDTLIWEVDEDSDGIINHYEFELMYKRSIFDKTGFEPRSLFNMVQFLMYDKGMKGKITVEDTLELLYVRVGRYNLDSEIYSIFGPEEKTSDGQEKAINFKEYLEKMRKKDFEKRKELEMERRIVKPPPDEDELKAKKLKI